MGYALDLFGRKKLTVIGLMISGIAIGCQPLPANLTGLYILRTIASIGILPVLYTPYTVDYIKKGSLGLITGYYTVIAQLASLVSTSGAIQAQKKFAV